MINSLFSGISGLNANSAALSIIGDNIANVNTTAFKSNRALFANVLNQSLSGFTGNEIGSGVKLTEITSAWDQGTLENTGKPTDLAINGEGFFIVSDGLEESYTRAGEFRFDAGGPSGNSLITPNGFIVQGYKADAAGVLPDPNDPATLTENITILDLDMYRNIEFNASGILSGVWSAPDSGTHVQGERETLFQICLADFKSIEGLARMSGNLYAKTVESGEPNKQAPNTGIGGVGSISPMSLEMSNVDIAVEFVKMITTQRAFQANSRVITTSDEILQEIINMKR